MKQLTKNLAIILLSALAFTACKKDENKVIFEGPAQPLKLVSSLASPSTVVLNIINKANTLMAFSWNNPEYRLNTGVSSQDVTYTLQVDTTGSNFTGKNIQEKSISKELSTNVTVGEMNAFLLSMELAFDVPHNVEIRLKASLSGGAVPTYSNVLKYTITPYLDVKYAVPANLYITGNATPSDWTNSPPAPQKFTKINAYTFEVTIPLIANNSYLFLDVFGSWDYKHGYDGSNNNNNTMGDNFKPGGGDMKAPAESGTYRITVDFKTGKFTLVKI
ncbi:SusE domain-containing protein [Ferruginibacter sp. HRS2-29]|uniref:SusE domain-containing protein n=1 Tax=Ferruginibacter sp. HRS2-29 TaxID=2487334 RepID=UPI0020CE1863|nr:SusE domain-containing protein [Ferruginibacter sp. HRS2-29]MCP9752633.1 hypothetical protein [Ferruginibacter sp. HRS2-29]